MGCFSRQSSSLGHGFKVYCGLALLALYMWFCKTCSSNVSEERTESERKPQLSMLSDPFSPMFPEKKPFVVWTMDMHMSTISDLHHRLTPLGVKFIWKSLSLHCRGKDRCAGKDLKVVNQSNALRLDPALIPRFYHAYKDDPDMQSVDAFLCFHPTSLCELFMPFNKSIIVIASTRYELGRDTSPKAWSRWNRNLIRLSKDDRNIIAANNLYDAEYMKYFTGINVQLLPSFCGYINQTYTPSKPGFLLFAGRGFKSTFSAIFLKDYGAVCGKQTAECPRIQYIKDAYPAGYKYEELVSHQGLVHAPYQVSIMSLFEQYRMNLPMFFPSLSLLSKWEHRRTWVKERIFYTIRTNLRPNGSDIRPHPSQRGIPDPNTVEDKYSIQYWLRFADFYQWPYITYYDSYEDLIDKLQTVDLMAVSRRMREYNVKFRERLDLKWKDILHRIASYSNKKFW